MLEAKNLCKSYQTGKIINQVLKGIDFVLDQGDIVVIRGPSGSGKSTLLNILGLLDEPTSGGIFLDQKKIEFKDFDRLAEVRSKVISFIFQSFNLNPVPLMIRKEIGKDVRRERVDEWIHKVGLNDHRLKKPDELSGGQRQRVAIARAMVTEPRIVIADEPTANLDSKTSKNILELMGALNQERKMAFIFATHDPMLDSFAKKRLYMLDGRLT
jgi:putative ABC transport system ATP-binding protein